MGKLIVIEGLDGSGISTQLSLLEKRLKEAGKDCRAVSFPDYAGFLFLLTAIFRQGHK